MTIGELPAVLESALHQLHRPIRQNPEMTVAVAMADGPTLVTFDMETNAALESHEISLSEPEIGNVTRYNTLSRWGRFFSQSQGRVVSFYLAGSVTEHERSLVTWSLHESNLKRDGGLELHARALVSPSGHVKRYNVTKVARHVNK